MSEFHKPLTEGPWDDCDLCGDSSGRLFCDLWSGLWVCDSCSRKGAKV